MNTTPTTNANRGARSRRGRRGAFRGNPIKASSRLRKPKLNVVMPNTYVCYMKYTSQLVGLSSMASNFMTQGWYLNSIYRPEVTVQILPTQLVLLSLLLFIILGRFFLLVLLLR